MTLTTRLTAFFLTALAIVLAGFAVAIYVLARDHLHRQANERLMTALDTLSAAADVSPEGVEWEPHERALRVGHAFPDGSILWSVRDPLGQVLDRFPADTSELPFDSAQGNNWLWTDREDRAWLAGNHLLNAPPSAQPPEKGKHPSLCLTCAVSLQPVRETLAALAWALAGTSAGVWILALVGGRWFCRRALRPVRRMAEQAEAMRGDAPGERFGLPGSHDELYALGASFNSLLGRLQEAYERQRRFTGDASHQLRTPLAAMLGQLEIALRRERSADDYRRALVETLEQGERLRRVVEALLFLTRADAESMTPRLEKIELSEWLSRHIKTWDTHPRTIDLRCETTGAVWARIQPQLLAQAVDNLIDNAAKYSPPESRITLRTGGDEHEVWLAIEDEGCGVRTEDMPHLFEPFFRSEEARNSGASGVGLGLSVVSRIAAALGGRVEVSARPGRGSRFTIHLPLANQEKADGESQAVSLLGNV